MSNFVSNSLNKITFHTLLLVGGVFLKKNKKNYKYAHNDLTILFKRATMQSTKKLNDNSQIIHKYVNCIEFVYILRQYIIVLSFYVKIILIL